MIPLGPFLLGGVLGKGGMGEVWSGLHRTQGVPVAIKVLTRQGTREPAFVAAFRNEVRAVAGLDHPGIVTIHDYGVVCGDADRASAGRLPAGRPFLVMEHVGGGPLGPYCGRIPWPVVRDILLGLLDALAHAHARGVVHRDLKPGNVLYRTDAPGVKLTDFGLAHAIEREQAARGEEVVTGTPAYMSPEQCDGRWRDTGPWTDLYSLGCVAWSLVTGSPPFGRPAPADAMAAHLYRALPAFEGSVPVPDGFEEWLHRLLQKDPARRFRRAADAAWALRGLGEPAPFPEEPGLVVYLPPADEDERSVSLTVPIPDLARRREGTATLSDVALPWLQQDAAPPPDESPLPPVRPPPFPDDWREPEGQRAPPALVGVGLGLFGLRAIRIVDREAERATLWRALADVHAARRPRLVRLGGATGSGKGRLAEWLCERAHATGTAAILRATHGPLRGPSDGLVPALVRRLRCVGLDRHAVVPRVQAFLRERGHADPEEAAALAELIAPAPPGDRAGATRHLPPEDGRPPGLPVVRFDTAAERHAVLRRVLERFAAERPLVLWLDDVQWGADSLDFALTLWEGAPFPVLVVATVTEEALPARPEEEERLDALVARARATRVDVGPLDTTAQRVLVRHRLGLEGALAATVEEHTAGNPLFAVTIVGDWIHRDLLEPGPEGFRLRSGARVALPAGLREAWADRIERLLEGRAPEEGHALEIAALLGQEVVGEEWAAACALAGVDPASGLVDAMLEARLARPGEEGPEARWFFAHAMLREGVEKRAQAAGRAAGWHRVCAEMLSARPGPGTEERRARHLIGAGAPDEALAPYLRAARERIDAGDYLLADHLLGKREEAMEAMGMPASDPRWGEGWITAGWLAFLRGLYDLSLGWNQRAEETAARHGWARVRARAVLEQANILRNRGDVERAAARLAAVEPLLRDLGDDEMTARWQLNQGLADSDRGRLEDALARFEAAREGFYAVGRDREAASCCDALFNLHKQLGRWDAAAASVEEALRRFDACGYRLGVADSLTNLGELARLRGDLEEAEALYRAALARTRAIGAANAAFPLVNLGLVLQDRERWAESRAPLEEGLASFAEQARLSYVGAVHACLLPSLVGVADWGAFDRHRAEAERMLGRTAFVDLDIARCAHRAAEMAAAAGEPRRAREAATLALAQWARLGRDGDRAAMEALIAGLGE